MQNKDPMAAARGRGHCPPWPRSELWAPLTAPTLRALAPPGQHSRCSPKAWLRGWGLLPSCVGVQCTHGAHASTVLRCSAHGTREHGVRRKAEEGTVKSRIRFLRNLICVALALYQLSVPCGRLGFPFFWPSPTRDLWILDDSCCDWCGLVSQCGFDC